MYSSKFPLRMFILISATGLVISSKLPPLSAVNSKFLHPNLTEEENLDSLIATVKDVNREARNADERKISNVKTFGFLSPMFAMLGQMSSPTNSNSNTNSYSSQYNIPGSTQVSSQGYTVPLYNYPFYNYFFGNGQGRTRN